MSASTPKTTRRVLPTYLGRVVDGTFKWYVLLHDPLTEDGKALVSYGPVPEPLGKAHPMSLGLAHERETEKRNKGYATIDADAISEPVRAKLLSDITQLSGFAHARFLDAGAILLATYPLKPAPHTRRRRPYDVWL